MSVRIGGWVHVKEVSMVCARGTGAMGAKSTRIMRIRIQRDVLCNATAAVTPHVVRWVESKGGEILGSKVEPIIRISTNQNTTMDMVAEEFNRLPQKGLGMTGKFSFNGGVVGGGDSVVREIVYRVNLQGHEVVDIVNTIPLEMVSWVSHVKDKAFFNQLLVNIRCLRWWERGNRSWSNKG